MRQDPTGQEGVGGMQGVDTWLVRDVAGIDATLIALICRRQRPPAAAASAPPSSLALHFNDAPRAPKQLQNRRTNLLGRKTGKTRARNQSIRRQFTSPSDERANERATICEKSEADRVVAAAATTTCEGRQVNADDDIDDAKQIHEDDSATTSH